MTDLTTLCYNLTKMSKLKDKRREEFCQQWIINFNGTQAAITAGFSKKTAAVQASQLLTKLNIQRRIGELLKDRSERTKITQDMVLQELAAMGFSNIKDYVNKDFSVKGSVIFKDIDKISREKAGAIESIKVDTEKGKIEFKLHNKPKSIELIGRHLGMFKDVGDQLAKVLYEISEQFMPKIGDKKEKKEDEEE